GPVRAGPAPLFPVPEPAAALWLPQLHRRGDGELGRLAFQRPDPAAERLAAGPLAAAVRFDVRGRVRAGPDGPCAGKNRVKISRKYENRSCNRGRSVVSYYRCVRPDGPDAATHHTRITMPLCASFGRWRAVRIPVPCGAADHGVRR